jgi:peptidoglycan/xylan/chitin deacetylase (PgdA/CDA1 family)
MFEQHMAYLHRKGYHCLSLDQALRDVQPYPHKSFVLTFDDGYLDLYSTAWPILDRFGFTATCFLVAGRAGRHADWDGTPEDDVTLLSWEEVRELSRSGFTFGSHTLTHPCLTRLDHEVATSEVQVSKMIIEDQLGIPVTLFSYPYGRSDARLQEIVAASGYLAACGVDRGHWNLFNLWRGECRGSDSLKSLSWKVRGGHQAVIRFREQTLVGQSLRRVVRALRASAC